MREWLRRLARLYPEGWRARYGEEFDALLGDVEPEWRAFADVVQGAFRMQMRTGASYLKLAGGLAVAGAVAALAASFAAPRNYVSSAVIQIRQEQVPGQEVPEGLAQDHATQQLAQMKQQILSRGSMSELMQRPALNLYREERSRIPVEDVVQQMRNHDIQIRMVSDGGKGPAAVNISYSSSEPEKSQAVVRELVAKFLSENVRVNRQRAELWQNAWQQSPPFSENVEIVTPASLPEAAGPNRLVFVAWGLGAGIVLGLVAASAMRRPVWTLQIGGFAAAGCAAAFAASYLVEAKYTSVAVMAFTPPNAPKHLADVATAMPVAWRLQRLKEKILTRASLAAMIQTPPLDLYRKDRQRIPFEDVVKKMREDIEIGMVRSPVTAGANGPAFRIAFTYPDPYKAQGVVRDLITAFMLQQGEEGEAIAARGGDFRKMEMIKAGSNLELLDPASVGVPVAPDRRAFGAAGLGVGLLAGAIAMRVRRRTSAMA